MIVLVNGTSIDYNTSERKESCKRISPMKKAFEELQLKDDFMFSVVMRNPKLCKPFLESFDLFGEGRHIYTFENRCVQNPELRLGDDATKMILNTKGAINDITPEMKRVLDFIDGRDASDEYTRALEKEIESVRKNEKWRLDYMTLQMKYEESIEQGMEIGIRAIIIVKYTP